MNSTIQEPLSSYPLGNTKLVKVALYARVSMPREGEDLRAQDPENQFIPLRRHADEHGYLVYEEYNDWCSGTDKERPGLDQLLRDARGHRFSLVLTTKVDRFARSVLHLYKVLEDLRAVHVAVRFIDQPEASTDTPQSELVLGILGHVAQFERSLISSRTKAGIARYRAQEGRWGAPRLDIEPGQIVALEAQGLSIAQIATQLGISQGTVRGRLREAAKKDASILSNEQASKEGGSE